MAKRDEGHRISEVTARVSERPAAAVVLAAGRGRRMGGGPPKMLRPLGGRPLLAHVLSTLEGLPLRETVVVVGPGRDGVRAAFAGRPLRWAVQERPLGTAHALRSGLRRLAGFGGEILVLCGDMPLLTAVSLSRVLRAHRRARNDVTLLSALVDDPRGYGRVVRDGRGAVRGIVEETDLSGGEQAALREVNTGTYAFRSETIGAHLARIGRANAQGEYYLTDVVARARGEGGRVGAVRAEDPAEAFGVNSLRDLWVAEQALRERALLRHVRQGVTIVDPASTWIRGEVRIGAGTVIHPFTVITGPVEIGRNCRVGPFTHLREGTRLEDGAEVGNFTEMKRSVLGAGSKAKHLSYLGDAEVGRGVNIGAGTITANYDGKAKNRTVIGDGAFVGSGTLFVAPVRLPRRTITGAGAVVVRGTEAREGDVLVGVPARSLRERRGAVASGPAPAPARKEGRTP